VARLAGLPAAVVARAKAILGELESERAALAAASAPSSPETTGLEPVQLGLFPPGGDPILKDLAALDIGTMTPLAALNLLAEWQRMIRERPQ
jgi:DNA mismatch repair protein MutS